MKINQITVGRALRTTTLAASACLMMAVSGPVSATAEDTTRLTTVMPTSPTTIDPAAVVGGDNFPLISMMAESLTTFDKDGELIPVLATDWVASEDGLTWTFNLREGVSFHDGTPFNAEAVKVSLDRLKSPDTVNAAPGVLRAIKSVAVVDDHTVDIMLNRPYAALPNALSLPQAAILSPTSLTVTPNTPELVSAPVGTGPYMFSEFVNGDHLTMVRNDAYRGEVPHYTEQVFLAVPESSSRLALLRSGEADIISLPPVSELPALVNDPQLEVIFTPTSYMIQMAINTQSQTQPLLLDPNVRQALSYAIDRETIVRNILFGAGILPQSSLASNVFGACQIGNFSYDPDRAREMLAASGAAGMSLSLIAPNGRYMQAPMVAQAVAGYLREVGLDAKLQNPVDWASYLSLIYAKPEDATRDMGLIGFGASFGDPSQALSLFLGSNVPPSGYNASYFVDTGFDDLMNKALAESDPAARAETYCQAQKVLAEKVPSLWLYVQSAPVVTSGAVDGVYGVNLWFVTTYATPRG